MWPPPISGSAGEKRVIQANLLKNWSSGPMTMLGRKIVASGNASRTAVSPAALLRAYAEVEWASAPRADMCTSCGTPASRAARATRPAASAWIA